MRDIVAAAVTAGVYWVGMTLTRLWGHFLIPVVLGTLFWALGGAATGWTFLAWSLWTVSFITVGWLLTLVSWVRFALEGEDD